MWLVITNCESLELKGLLTPADLTHLSTKSVIAFSLQNKKKKTFSAAMDQVFLFTFNACSLCLSEEKNKAE